MARTQVFTGTFTAMRRGYGFVEAEGMSVLIAIRKALIDSSGKTVGRGKVPRRLKRGEHIVFALANDDPDHLKAGTWRPAQGW